MDNKFWMNVWAVIVAMLLMSWVVRPVLGGVLGVKEGNSVMGIGPGDFKPDPFNWINKEKELQENYNNMRNNEPGMMMFKKKNPNEMMDMM